MSDPLAKLGSLPRLELAHLPTPMERMPRLAAHLGLDALWVKRDDCTGLGLGGNKARKLEFSLAAALRAGADCVVCGGVVQSNAARQVAAACAKLDLPCHLGIMRGRVSGSEPAYEASGNILLDRLFGAEIHDLAWNEDRNLGLRGIVDELIAGGRKPYLVPYGGSDGLGAMGYVVAAREIVQQQPNVGSIVHASGSAGTQAGLIVGLLAHGHSARVIGIDADAQPERVRADVRRIGREAAALLGIQSAWRDDLVEVAEDWSAGAYGKSDENTQEAIRIAARWEGLVLDPVYSGKGMAGLIGLARRGRFKRDETVVFVHTGGAPGIFAQPRTMAALSSQ